MIQAFYTSTAGMKAYQKTIDVISNNISNANTPGYRLKRAEFQEILDQQTGKNNQIVSTGFGAKIANISTMPLPSDINPLGMEISGDGYFVLEDNTGQRSYTKDGDFVSTNQNGINYLTTKSGEYVLDSDGNRIELPADKSNIVVSGGKIYTNENSQDGINLGVVKFDNMQGMSMRGFGQFVTTNQSSQPITVINPGVTSSYYDELASDVTANQINEMTKIVQTQMAYQFNSKVLQTADELEGMANHLRY